MTADPSMNDEGMMQTNTKKKMTNHGGEHEQSTVTRMLDDAFYRHCLPRDIVACLKVTDTDSLCIVFDEHPAIRVFPVRC